MTIANDDRLLAQEFLTYMEEFEAPDERYGASQRHDNDAAGLLALRFATDGHWSFEVGVESAKSRIRIAFVTNESDGVSSVQEAIEESGTTLASLVTGCCQEAGLTGDLPAVEVIGQGQGVEGFACYLPVEDLVDLADPRIRTKVIKMLEGFLLAFGPEVEVDGWDDHDPE